MLDPLDQEAISAMVADLRAMGRFAPRPKAWDSFYKQIADGQTGVDRLPPPLILSAHWATTASDKALRLEEQLCWAARAGRLEVAMSTLRSLGDDAWRPLPLDRWPLSAGDL